MVQKKQNINENSDKNKSYGMGEKCYGVCYGLIEISWRMRNDPINPINPINPWERTSAG